MASPLSPARVREMAAGLGLSIDMYQPFRDFEGVGPERLEANLRRARRKFELMAELGADTMLVCSNVAAGRHRRRRAVRRPAAPAGRRGAAEHGVRIAFEALAWGRHINDYRAAWDVVERAGHPALGTCLDSFHILSRGSDPAAIEQIPGDKIFFLQLADAPVLGMDVLQWSRHHRCFPGQGGFDLAAFMGHVQAAGYDGPWSLEVFNDHFRQAEPERIAIDARRSLLALGEQAGAADAAARAARRAASRSPSWPWAPPRATGPPRCWRRWASPTWARTAPSPCTSGARATRACCSTTATATPATDALVSALGMESADPDGAAARAEDLGAALLPRRRGPGEADLAAIAAPDDTTVLFCRTASGGTRGWATSSSWTRPEARAAASPAWTTSCCRSRSTTSTRRCCSTARCWGSSPARPRTWPRRTGCSARARSRPRAAALRLAITVPRLGGGDGRLGELQHVAFAGDDVLGVRAPDARARRAAAGGARQLLRRPGGAHGPGSRAHRGAARPPACCTTPTAGAASSCSCSRR